MAEEHFCENAFVWRKMTFGPLKFYSRASKTVTELSRPKADEPGFWNVSLTPEELRSH